MNLKALVLLLVVSLAFPRFCEGKQLWAKSYLNKKAPDLVVEKWLTEKPETKGKFVLIDFWATWCPPCRAAIPELNEIKHRFGDRVVVIGLSDEPEAKVHALKEPKIEYFVAIDTKKKMKDQLEVTGIPHLILLDPEGIVRWEGFPFLAGYEFSPEVVAEIIKKYGK